MDSSHVLLLAFFLGVVTGLRSMTGPAVLAWAAHHNWLNLHNTSLSFMASTMATVFFLLAAVGELIADQLPSTPSRTKPPGLIARVLFGGLCGAGIAAVGSRSAAGPQSLVVGALVGVAGAVIGTYAGHEVRTRLVAALHVPDFIIATLEDIVAIGGGLFIVSRF